MNFADIKGISLASGFKLQAESPLDARNVVDTIEERDALVTIHAAYEGLRVYVKANKVIYVYNGRGWTNTNTTYGLASSTANGLLSDAEYHCGYRYARCDCFDGREQSGSQEVNRLRKGGCEDGGHPGDHRGGHHLFGGRRIGQEKAQALEERKGFHRT